MQRRRAFAGPSVDLPFGSGEQNRRRMRQSIPSGFLLRNLSHARCQTVRNERPCRSETRSVKARRWCSVLTEGEVANLTAGKPAVARCCVRRAAGHRSCAQYFVSAWQRTPSGVSGQKTARAPARGWRGHRRGRRGASALKLDMRRK